MTHVVPTMHTALLLTTGVYERELLMSRHASADFLLRMKDDDARDGMI